MNVEELREYCLSKKGTSECFPFDEETLVFKVLDKMFALCGLEKAEFVNLKCDPDWAIELREEYPQITGGYHMSKKYWNTVKISELSNDLMIKLIDHSYDKVVEKMTKKNRLLLEQI